MQSELTQMLERFHRDLQKHEKIQFAPPQTAEFQGKTLKATIVIKAGKDDIIFQFFAPRFPKMFRELLAETLEAHFGGTGDFALDFVPEMKSYALLARGILARPTVSVDYVTVDFLNLLDEVLSDPEVRS